jgi:hypothetical protein
VPLSAAVSAAMLVTALATFSADVPAITPAGHMGAAPVVALQLTTDGAGGTIINPDWWMPGL